MGCLFLFKTGEKIINNNKTIKKKGIGIDRQLRYMVRVATRFGFMNHDSAWLWEGGAIPETASVRGGLCKWAIGGAVCGILIDCEDL